MLLIRKGTIRRMTNNFCPLICPIFAREFLFNFQFVAQLVEQAAVAFDTINPVFETHTFVTLSTRPHDHCSVVRT